MNYSRISKVPAIVSSILSFIALANLPYGYYSFLRIFITIACIYYIYNLNELKENADSIFWGLVIIGILFNPIVPIYLNDKGFWFIINIVTGGLFIILINKLKNHHG